ncbi:hypothetical protein [Cryobacterium psychrophilum]|nr:hypothetical protein [Cryobacterium psychrophilum]
MDTSEEPEDPLRCVAAAADPFGFVDGDGVAPELMGVELISRA